MVLAQDGSCVNAPGQFFNTSSNTAQPCPPNSFSPGVLRQPACIPCPGSSVTHPGSPQVSRSSWAACFVPPGWRAPAAGSTDLVRCPRGTFRPSFAPLSSSAALRCNRCPAGSTTQGMGSTSMQQCSVLLPGFFWLARRRRGNVIAPLPPPQPDATRNLSIDASQTQQLPTPCPSGHYCPGGVGSDNSGITRCPNGLWTQGAGAADISQCMVPPGHFLAGSGEAAAVQRCPAGDLRLGTAGAYQPDWRAPGNQTAAACFSCGANILAGALHPLAVTSIQDDGTVKTDKTRVARTAAACYILQGMGMQLDPSGSPAPDGTPAFSAAVCNANNHGVPGPSYGLRVQPCTPCLPGMVTDDKFKSSVTGGYFDPAACLVPPGFGLIGDAAVPCPKGTWNNRTAPAAVGCRPCSPAGLTTRGNLTGATSPAACSWVLPGWGYSTALAPFRCPRGTYSDAERRLAADAPGDCTPCPGNRTTPAEGASSTAECTSCQPGTGTSNTILDDPSAPQPPPLDTAQPPASPGASCSPCRSGFFGSRLRADGDTACYPCGLQSLQLFYYGGDINVYQPAAVTQPGARSAEACLPEFSVISEPNWWLPSSASAMLNASAAVPAAAPRLQALEACLQACRQAGCGCQFASYDYSSRACLLRVAAAVADSRYRVAYKLTGDSLAPSGSTQPAAAAAAAAAESTTTQAAAATVKGMGSGLFSWWDDNSEAARIGLPLAVLGAGSSVTSCLAACTDDSDCALVFFEFELGAGGGVSSSSSVVRCELRQGDSSYSNSVRTMLRTQVSDEHAAWGNH
uniref:Tyrosine-protein kinase ephrin type A/B receptor-like domain-containing protein n=1 Tax=Tetradesmus obliquus TaxID=3088 RepID=A0A383VEK0_TETOB|eukprot:jgi/Sobl393_1/7132/SZX63162.1